MKKAVDGCVIPVVRMLSRIDENENLIRVSLSCAQRARVLKHELSQS